MTAKVTHAVAAAELAGRDPVLAELIADIGPPRLRPPAGTHFESLVRAIAFQQLAGAAAAAIHGRLVALAEENVTPDRLVALTPEQMRAVGLSTAKIASIHDLAAKALDGSIVLDGRKLGRMTDDEIVTQLSTVRGVGRWTAEMFLLFQLRRLDVWPVGDLGVQRGYSLTYRVPMPRPRHLELFGDRFRPYRSVAAWYCWRAVDRARRGTASAVTG